MASKRCGVQEKSFPYDGPVDPFPERRELMMTMMDEAIKYRGDCKANGECPEFNVDSEGPEECLGGE